MPEYFLPRVSGLWLHFYSPKSVKWKISNTIAYKVPAIKISDVRKKVLSASSWSYMLWEEGSLFPDLAIKA